MLICNEIICTDECFANWNIDELYSLWNVIDLCVEIKHHKCKQYENTNDVYDNTVYKWNMKQLTIIVDSKQNYRIPLSVHLETSQ